MRLSDCIKPKTYPGFDSDQHQVLQRQIEDDLPTYSLLSWPQIDTSFTSPRMVMLRLGLDPGVRTSTGIQGQTLPLLIPIPNKDLPLSPPGVLQQSMRENKEKQALSDLMIKPVQRIPRYELLVKVRGPGGEVPWWMGARTDELFQGCMPLLACL